MQYYDSVTGKMVDEGPAGSTNSSATETQAAEVNQSYTSPLTSSGVNSNYTSPLTSSGVNPSYTAQNTGVNPSYTAQNTGVNPSYTAQNTGVNPSYTAQNTGVNPSYTAQNTGVNPSYTAQNTGVNPSYTAQNTGVNPSYTAQNTGVNPGYTAQNTGVNPSYTAQNTGVNPSYTAQNTGVNPSYTAQNTGVNPSYTARNAGVNPSYTAQNAGVNPSYTAQNTGVNPSYTAQNTGVNPSYTGTQTGMESNTYLGAATIGNGYSSSSDSLDTSSYLSSTESLNISNSRDISSGGKAVNKYSGSMSEEDLGYDSMIGSPYEMDMPTARGGGFEGNNKSNGTVKIVLGVIAGLVAIIVVILVLLFNGVFLSPSQKVMYAISNTFKEAPQMAKVYDSFGKDIPDSLTMNMLAEVDGNFVDIQYAYKEDVYQLSGNIEMADAPKIEFLGELNPSLLKLQFPGLFDSVFVYDYTQEKTGYLAEMMGSETVEEIDNALKSVYTQETNWEVDPEVIKLLKEEYEKLEFEKVGTREFTINEKTVKSQGYRLVITEADMLDYIDVMQNIVMEAYADEEQMIQSLETGFDDLRKEVIGFDTIDLTFYIAKNKLTCLSMGYNGQTVDLVIKGQEGGLYDIAVCSGNMEVFVIDGIKGTDTERYELKTLNTNLASFEYNIRSGRYHFEITNGTEQITAEGLMSGTADTATFTIDKLQGYDDLSGITCDVTLMKGAELKEFDGEEFNLGNASEEELTEVMMGATSLMY